MKVFVEGAKNGELQLQLLVVLGGPYEEYYGCHVNKHWTRSCSTIVLKSQIEKIAVIK